MKYYAKLVSLSEDVEEEAIFSFGEYNICCFIDYSPIKLDIGNIYLIDLGVRFLDDELIEQSNNREYSLKRKGNSFQYEMNGYLFEDNFILSNLILRDELFYDYSYLENGFVKIQPDRITVSIIEI